MLGTGKQSDSLRKEENYNVMKRRRQQYEIVKKNRMNQMKGKETSKIKRQNK